MQSNNQEIQSINQQLKDWSVQMAVLAAKKEAALATATQFGMQLEVLRSQHREVSQRLRILQAREDALYMWENIGDGG